MKGIMNQRQWIPIEESPAPMVGLINKISWVVVAVVSALFLMLGFLVSLNVIPGVIAGIGAYLLMRSVKQNSESRILGTSPSMAASEIAEARLFNVVDGLCVVGGDQRPALRVVGSEFPIALAVAAPHSAGTIIVSSGFISTMDRVETEAVMAHLLWRIRSGEVALVTFLSALTTVASRLGLSGAVRRVSEKVSDPRRVIWADISGCQATRYPPAMVSALEKVLSSNADTGDVPVSPLWFAVPENHTDATHETSDVPNVGEVSVSLAERIAVLKEI
jgi:heat shock protein HtpX